MVCAQNKRLTIADVTVQLPMKKAGIGSVGSVLSRLSSGDVTVVAVALNHAVIGKDRYFSPRTHS